MENSIYRAISGISPDLINFLTTNKGIEKSIASIDLELLKFKLTELGMSDSECDKVEDGYKRILHLRKKHSGLCFNEEQLQFVDIIHSLLHEVQDEICSKTHPMYQHWNEWCELFGMDNHKFSWEPKFQIHYEVLPWHQETIDFRTYPLTYDSLFGYHNHLPISIFETEQQKNFIFSKFEETRKKYLQEFGEEMGGLPNLSVFVKKPDVA